MTMAKALVSTALCLLSLVLACGGNKPEPVTPPDVADAAAASVEPPVQPLASSSASAPSTPPPESSAAASAAPAASSKPPVTLGETKDECTPVGVDFEKRARPKVKECYAEGKKKSPNLEGTVKIKVTVDLKGKIKSVKITEKTLPDPVAECMLKAVKATPFPEVEKCWDASLLIPITFPTPK